MSSYAEKMTAAVGRPVDAAASVRSRGAMIWVAIGAGIGAAAGSILIGGALGGGLGGGGGAAVGFALAMLLSPKGDPPVPAFAVLLVEPEQVVVCKQSMWSNKPDGELFSLPYEQIRSIESKTGILSMRLELELADGRRLELEAGKAGPAGGADVVELLTKRVSA